MIFMRETFCQVQNKQSLVQSISLLACYLTGAFIALWSFWCSSVIYYLIETGLSYCFPSGITADLLPTKLKTSSKKYLPDPTNFGNATSGWPADSTLWLSQCPLLTGAHSWHGSVPVFGVEFIFFPLVKMPTRPAYNIHRAVRLRELKSSSSVSNKAAS